MNGPGAYPLGAGGGDPWGGSQSQDGERLDLSCRGWNSTSRGARNRAVAAHGLAQGGGGCRFAWLGASFGAWEAPWQSVFSSTSVGCCLWLGKGSRQRRPLLTIPTRVFSLFFQRQGSTDQSLAASFVGYPFWKARCIPERIEHRAQTL